nr:MAG: ORF1 [TTV-like mini virus]
MPWRRRYYWRRRRRRPWLWRPRQAFRRRLYRRRRWVRKFYKPKRKLKKLRLTEYQPRSIRKCTVKGLLSLFQTNTERICFNFDMYEESIVPDRLPGGGGFSIKNLTLQSLYQEHIMGHNIFTHSNIHYPLCRYLGCRLTFYQSLNIDYIVTYSNSWPLRSSLQMYNTMQPAIHSLQKHKLIIPSKQTSKRKKPYKRVFIPPPTQMLNKWYFQHDIAKTALFMLRTTCCSLDHWYIGNRMKSTNISIFTLNYTVIQNRKFNKSTEQYFNRWLGTQKYYLYSTKEHFANIQKVKLEDLICLGNTKDYQHGISYADYKAQTGKQDVIQYSQDLTTWGNPFHTEYIHKQEPILTSAASWAYITTKIQNNANATIENIPEYPFSLTEISEEVRYNPYKDDGSENECYFLSALDGGHGWDPPDNPDLTNENLPLWIMLFGFSDFEKKIGKQQHIDTDYIFTIKTKKTYPNKQVLIPISYSFILGNSPYENDTQNPKDTHLWYPCFQYQQEIYNDICLCGPGTPKIDPGNTVEAKVKYQFYFKWGGEQPPMDIIDNPSDKTTYPVPNKELQTSSLQNPTQAPETFLFRFDERRGMLTTKATKRITKDWETKKDTFSSTAPRFAETTQILQEDSSQESTSEEEKEESLYQQLQQQRAKQQRLKHRIMKTLQQLQKLE